MKCTANRTTQPPPVTGDWETRWNSPPWSQAETIDVTHWHAQGSDHRPRTQCKVLWDDDALHLLWRVEDRYIRCVRTEYISDVYNDTAVEFFFEPSPELGYMNIEVNCGGAFLVGIPGRDGKPVPPDAPPGFGRERLPWEQAKEIELETSMPRITDPEIAGPLTWYLRERVPLSVIEWRFDPLRPLAGKRWRVNFYKISGDNSHPHYGQWSPIGERLSFHQPQYFGEMDFID